MQSFVYDSPDFRAFLRNSPHERGEVSFLNSIAQEGMRAMDIGANVGIGSVAIAKRIGNRGRLHSFEPLPEYFDILKKNVCSNGLENVEIHQLAVTDRVGSVDFYHRGLSSGILFEEGATKSRVYTTTVDRFLNEEGVGGIDLINMDCECSELLVLKGAQETLQKHKVRIFCEIHHAFLKQLGQSAGELVECLRKLRFEVQSVCLDDLRVGNDFEKCEYIYAWN